MPAPYQLLDMPAGDFSNMFDFPAINMAAAHNMFIQGINAAVAHAPHITPDKVQPFMIFCLTILNNIHHHHDLEEEFYFPVLEEKLGKGALSANIDQHAQFVPQIEETEKWLKGVQTGKETFEAQVFLAKIYSFADKMFEHLNCEIPTLESSKLRAVFTERELKEIDEQFMKIALKSIDFHTSLPLAISCSNPATPWFPPLPLPIKWANRWWFSRKYREAWEFGPMDFNGNSRALPGPKI